MKCCAINCSNDCRRAGFPGYYGGMTCSSISWCKFAVNANTSKLAQTNKTQTSLVAIAKLFLKLGVTGFGGPAVHIAMMKDEVVEKRKWMTEDHFLDLVGATNLIPGPNSTEMTMHIGHERAGWRGLVVAGCCFIFPAVIITAIIAYLYQVYGQLPQVQPFIYGIKPAIVAVVFSLMIDLGKKACKNLTLVLIGIMSAIAVLAGVNEILVLFGAGAIGILLSMTRNPGENIKGMFPVVLLQIAGVSSAGLFFIFLKIGAILYGSGYVLFAFLDAELVGRGWITHEQLVDAIAVGQFTPGPVFSSATFIGWQISGLTGALLATVGIFLPSFLFVALLNPLLPLIRKSKIMSAFLDTVNMASVAIILAVLVSLSKAVIPDWRAVIIAVLGFALTFYFKKLNTAIIILGGAVLGYVLLLI